MIVQESMGIQRKAGCPPSLDAPAFPLPLHGVHPDAPPLFRLWALGLVAALGLLRRLGPHRRLSSLFRVVLLKQVEEALGVGAEELVDLLAVLEEGEGGHGADAELLGEVGHGVDVELGKIGLVLKLGVLCPSARRGIG